MAFGHNELYRPKDAMVTKLVKNRQSVKSVHLDTAALRVVYAQYNNPGAATSACKQDITGPKVHQHIVVHIHRLITHSKRLTLLLHPVIMGL